MSVSWMSLLREQWKDTLKSAVPSSTGTIPRFQAEGRFTSKARLSRLSQEIPRSPRTLETPPAVNIPLRSS